jgi:FKBP-type peptidyl-prolyl cis-trans isomerase (trigger factor)
MIRRRPSLRDTIARNQQSMDLYAALSNKPRVELTAPPPPKPRTIRKPSASGTEADVMRAVHDLLRRHRRVAWFMRLNSGAVSDGDRVTVFYRLYMRGMPVRTKGASDYLGQLTDGRMFLVECKRPGVHKATEEQQDLISACVAAGGVAGIAQSVEDVIALLGEP